MCMHMYTHTHTHMYNTYTNIHKSSVTPTTNALSRTCGSNTVSFHSGTRNVSASNIPDLPLAFMSQSFWYLKDYYFWCAAVELKHLIVSLLQAGLVQDTSKRSFVSVLISIKRLILDNGSSHTCSFSLAFSLENPRPWETMQSHSQASWAFILKTLGAPSGWQIPQQMGGWECSVFLPHTLAFTLPSCCSCTHFLFFSSLWIQRLNQLWFTEMVICILWGH